MKLRGNLFNEFEADLKLQLFSRFEDGLCNHDEVFISAT